MFAGCFFVVAWSLLTACLWIACGFLLVVCFLSFAHDPLLVCLWWGPRRAWRIGLGVKLLHKPRKVCQTILDDSDARAVYQITNARSIWKIRHSVTQADFEPSRLEDGHVWMFAERFSDLLGLR